PPPNWYGIHWGNEFWGTKTSNHSVGNGEFATKNSPAAGSLLQELYRTYALIDPRETGDAASPVLKSAALPAARGGNARSFAAATGLIEMAAQLVERGNPVIFTHLIKRHDLEVLWRVGVATAPVIHNSKQGWGEAPSSYDNANVPFVIACADSVKAEIVQEGC